MTHDMSADSRVASRCNTVRSGLFPNGCSGNIFGKRGATHYNGIEKVSNLHEIKKPAEKYTTKSDLTRDDMHKSTTRGSDQ